MRGSQATKFLFASCLLLSAACLLLSAGRLPSADLYQTTS